jgi:hypothetical protein
MQQTHISTTYISSMFRPKNIIYLNILAYIETFCLELLGFMLKWNIVNQLLLAVTLFRDSSGINWLTASNVRDQVFFIHTGLHKTCSLQREIFATMVLARTSIFFPAREYKLVYSSTNNKQFCKKYKFQNRANKDLWIYQRWIRCLGWVSTPCRPVTPAVNPISNAKISSQIGSVYFWWTKQSAVKSACPVKLRIIRCTNQCPDQVNGSIHSKTLA